MIFLSFAASALIFIYTVRGNFKIFDPYTIFSVSYLYYYYFIPMHMTVTGDFRTYTPGLQVYVSPDAMNQMSLMLATGFLAFTLGYKLIKSPFDNQKFLGSVKTSSPEDNHYIRAILMAAFALLLVMFTVYRETLVLVFSGYQAKIDTIYAASAFSWVYRIVLVLGSVILNHAILYGRRPILLTTAAVLGYLVLAFASSSKDGMVFGLLSVACGIYRVLPKRQWLAFAGLLGGATFALVYLVPMFSVYRADGVFVWSGAGIHHDMIYSDALGPFVALVMLMSSSLYSLAHPLYQAVYLWVPRALWPDRPLDIAESFARDVMANWRPGIGMGFSPVAEGYQRFGLFLSPLHLFLTGFLFALLQYGLARFSSPRLRLAIIVTVNGYVAFVTNRGPVSSLVTQTVQIWVPIIAILMVAALTRAHTQTNVER